MLLLCSDNFCFLILKQPKFKATLMFTSCGVCLIFDESWNLNRFYEKLTSIEIIDA